LAEVGTYSKGRCRACTNARDNDRYLKRVGSYTRSKQDPELAPEPIDGVHCKIGHPLSGDNVKPGHKECLACRRKRVREWAVTRRRLKSASSAT